MGLLNYLMENWMPIGVAIGGMVGWFFDSKKRKAELIALQLANEQNKTSIKTGLETASTDIYKKLFDTVSVQIDEMRENLSEMREENLKLKEKITDLENQLDLVNKERLDLINQVRDFKNQNDELKIKIESYEKELKLYRKENKK